MKRGHVIPLGTGRTPSVARGAFVVPGATVIGTVRVADGAGVWSGTVLRAGSPR